MLNKDYKLGSTWKLTLILPLIFIALFFVSCTKKDVTSMADEAEIEEISAAKDPVTEIDGELFYVVEEMPTFQGEEALEFRKYIARNLVYPKEAKENGVTGKVFIKFIVSSTGKVIVPEAELMAEMDGKELDEVVVAAYRTLEKDAENPEQKYIDLLIEEVIRVVSESPDWEPGKQRGKAVNVAYTFPIKFTMQ